METPQTTGLEKIWSIELDLFKKFKEICAKYDLSYCAYSGTLLGAVRHKGFIPWDDDMDLFLPWPDYVKLLEAAPKECSYPYCFQSFLTDPEGEASACRLRRSDTTGFTKWEHENITGKDYDKGIFIDIFPLFNVPDSESEKNIQKESVLFFWKCMRGYNAVCQSRLWGKANKDYEQYIPYYKSVCRSMSITDIKWAYLNACAMVDGKTREVGATSEKIHLPITMWPSEWYASYVDLPFENMTIKCPVEYEKVLEKQYGDWRKPVKDGAVHVFVAIDPETPWKNYDMSSILVK